MFLERNGKSDLSEKKSEPQTSLPKLKHIILDLTHLNLWPWLAVLANIPGSELDNSSQVWTNGYIDAILDTDS